MSKVAKYLGIAVFVLSGCVDPGVWIGLANGDSCRRDGECRSTSCVDNICVDRVEDMSNDAADSDASTDASTDATHDAASDIEHDATSDIGSDANSDAKPDDQGFDASD